MELELCLHPDDAVRLLRLPRLAPLKSGKVSSRPVRTIWHDGAGRELAQQGLALAKHRSQWELERLRPHCNRWPPGARAPVLACAKTPEQLGRPLPSPLLPIVALEGHASQIGLMTEQGAITMTLLIGEVRGVVGQHRVNRLILQGGIEPVRALALALATDTRLVVPSTSLASEAFAVATGVPSAPGPEGPPKLPEGLSIAEALAYVLGHLGGAIIQLAPKAADSAAGQEPVHQMRVAVRRLRSAIKVFCHAVTSPTIIETDKALKALAAILAPARDWDVFVTETAAAVLEAIPTGKRLRRLLAAAERQRRACREDLCNFLGGTEFRQLGIHLACFAGELQDPAATDASEGPKLLTEFGTQVLGKRYRRLVRVDHQLSALEPAALHQIRLHAKRLRYTAEIFATMFPGKPTHRFLHRLSSLQNCLGALNDGAVAERLMHEVSKGSHGFAIGLVLGFVAAHNRKARRQIDRAWERFSRLEPFWA